MIRTPIAVCAVMLGLGAAYAGEVNLAATVNGEGIARTRLQSSVDASMRRGRMNYGGITKPDQYKRLQRQVLDQLIAQKLLWQEANRQGFVATPAEVEQALERLRKRYQTEEAYLQGLEQNGLTAETYREGLKREISVQHWVRETIAQGITVADAEVHDYYVKNRAQFVQPEGINARHVLIKVGPDADEATVAAARKKIEPVLAKARQGADFAELAKQYSQGPSAPRGGALGLVPRGQLVKPFEDAAFALKPGEISDIVRTRYGFHIIKLEARRESGVAPEKEVVPSIRNYLSSTKVQELVQDRVRTLREKGSVEILISLAEPTE